MFPLLQVKYNCSGGDTVVQNQLILHLKTITLCHRTAYYWHVKWLNLDSGDTTTLHTSIGAGTAKHRPLEKLCTGYIFSVVDMHISGIALTCL